MLNVLKILHFFLSNKIYIFFDLLIKTTMLKKLTKTERLKHVFAPSRSFSLFQKNKGCLQTAVLIGKQFQFPPEEEVNVKASKIQ